MSVTKQSQQNYSFFLVVIILMGSVGLFASDIYLPALPEMATYFNCTQSEIQASLMVYLIGLSVCQLAAGVLSDLFGRKKVVFIGLSLFIVSTILCAYAETLLQFNIFRGMQAMGGGVGSVVGRSIVAHRFNRQQAVKVFSTTFPIVGMSAAVAPLVGGYLTDFFGWRAAFFFMVFYGITVLTFCMFGLRNNYSVRNEEPNDHLDFSQNSTQKFSGYFGILRNFEFLGFALLVCTGFAVFRSYAAASPFIFYNQGFAAEEIGAFYIMPSVAYLLGNLTAKRLVNVVSMRQVLKIGILFFTAGCGSMLLTSFIFPGTPYAIILPMTLVTFGNGFLFPVGSAGAMTSVRAEYSGTASGLLGSLQFMMAAFCIYWIGKLCQEQAIQMSIFLISTTVIGFTSCFLLVAYRPKADVNTISGEI